MVVPVYMHYVSIEIFISFFLVGTGWLTFQQPRNRVRDSSTQSIQRKHIIGITIKIQLEDYIKYMVFVLRLHQGLCKKTTS